MNEFLNIRPLGPNDCMDSAVFCATCVNFKQDIIGGKCGTCFGHEIKDGNIPMQCPHFGNHLQVLSVLVFLKSGISIYDRAIVPDAKNQMDPQMLSSFLQAINMFGEELTQEQVSQIQFQKMNIFVCRNVKAYGAMLVKGEVQDALKKVFTDFLKRIEEKFPEYFLHDYSGACLPTEEVDRLGFTCIKEYMDDYPAVPFHPMPKQVVESEGNLKVAYRHEA